MKVHWTDWALLTAIAGAGCAAGFVAIRAGLARATRRAVSERQRETERQLSALNLTVKSLEARVAELSRLHGARDDAVAGEASAEIEASEKKQPIKPEIVVALTAAATTFLGKKARIRSAHALPAQDGAGAWAQQGRVIVQTSHNLHPNG